MEKTEQKVSISLLQGMMTEIKELFRETDKKFQATDKKFQATDKKFQATDRQSKEDHKFIMAKFQATESLLDEQIKERKEEHKRWKEKFDKIQGEIGGIGNSNGAVAEDFFYNALSNSLQVANMHFDYIDFNLHRKKKQLEAEYDIILYNHYKILIIEVKYNFKKQKLRPFHEGLKKFKALYPEHSSLKLYGAVAALTYEDGAIEEAKDYGFYVLSQNNNKLKLGNAKDFVPNEIK